MSGSVAEDRRVNVLIASPLESDYVAEIARVAPDRVNLIYRPDLLPPMRYVADHTGPADWARTVEQQAEWEALLERAEAMWDFDLRTPKSPLALSPNLRWVQTTSAGVGPLVKRLGVADSDLLVTTASGIHAQPLAEFVFGALLFSTKQFARLLHQQRAHHWERYCASELSGQTLAIIGPGRIGREIARLGHCFGMTVWAMGRTYDDDRAATLGVDRLFPRDDLPVMLAGADCVVICTPHTPETERILGAKEFAALKPGAVFINIARGAVVDEAALIEALQSERIGFAALDVFQTEPLPADSPLWDMPNVLINPHSASTAASENRKLTERFCQNLDHYLAGRLDQMGPVLDKARQY
ncbi:MAG TPA: D-2-hydroxyacid dehydrogenase [Thermomicrobiales bacterium]|nr:D-2-hydroxyacid dehydrogenase [Thermomicrobiales bacterium]